MCEGGLQKAIIAGIHRAVGSRALDLPCCSVSARRQRAIDAGTLEGRLESLCPKASPSSRRSRCRDAVDGGRTRDATSPRCPWATARTLSTTSPTLVTWPTPSSRSRTARARRLRLAGRGRPARHHREVRRRRERSGLAHEHELRRPDRSSSAKWNPRPPSGAGSESRYVRNCPAGASRRSTIHVRRQTGRTIGRFADCARRRYHEGPAPRRPRPDRPRRSATGDRTGRAIQSIAHVEVVIEVDARDQTAPDIQDSRSARAGRAARPPTSRARRRVPGTGLPSSPA